jgi:hypothetical protein
LADYYRIENLFENELESETEFQAQQVLKKSYDEATMLELMEDPVFLNSLTRDEMDEMELMTYKL